MKKPILVSLILLNLPLKALMLEAPAGPADYKPSVFFYYDRIIIT